MTFHFAPQNIENDMDKKILTTRKQLVINDIKKDDL